MTGRMSSSYSVLQLQSDASIAGTMMLKEQKPTAEHQRGQPHPGVRLHEDPKGPLHESRLFSLTKLRPHFYFSNMMKYNMFRPTLLFENFVS